MAPRGRKRKSEQSVDSEAQNTTGSVQQVAVHEDGMVETPRKKRKVGITLAQKQALIDNLQLEVTERARKLRAQYNLQAQSLRTRIEIRVNRIPVALRKMKMGDLLEKYSADHSSKPNAALPLKSSISAAARPPPVPEKDYPPARRAVLATSARSDAPRAGPGRPPKRLSESMAGGDKENCGAFDNQEKKRARGGMAATRIADHAQILSPTSSNSRLNRPASSPSRSMIARPVSPSKERGNLISTMVEKARSTRTGAGRKNTTSSTASSSAAGMTSTRGKKGAAGATAATKASTTRTARRASGVSESSEGSTTTVVRKTAGRPTAAAKAAAQTAAAPSAKKNMMSSIKKGVAGATAKKAAAQKGAQPAGAATRSGRVLRKRD